MRGRMLSADRAYLARETTFDNELEWLAAEFCLNGMEHLPAPSESDQGNEWNVHSAKSNAAVHGPA
jgi:hypothetical protein